MKRIVEETTRRPSWIYTKPQQYNSCTSNQGSKQLPSSTTMPKHKCPFPNCTYETADVEDALAAVLISVHSTGTHTATAPPPASAGVNAAKIDRVRRPIISTAGSSEDWSYFLTRCRTISMQGKSPAKTMSSNYLSVVTINFEKTSHETQGVR